MNFYPQVQIGADRLRSDRRASPSLASVALAPDVLPIRLADGECWLEGYRTGRHALCWRPAHWVRVREVPLVLAAFLTSPDLTQGRRALSLSGTQNLIAFTVVE